MTQNETTQILVEINQGLTRLLNRLDQAERRIERNSAVLTKIIEAAEKRGATDTTEQPTAD